MYEGPPRLKRATGVDLSQVHRAFAYQFQAVEAVKHLEHAALFHEQGLGKTKIGIDLSLEWLKADVIDCVVIVTKKGLVANWADEVRAHSHLHPRILGQDRAANFLSLNSPAPLYLTHYEVVRGEERRLSLFLRTRRVALVLDEAHKIKNPEAEVTRALHRLSPLAAKRVIMTGTPVANRPFDLWSQVYFLDQGSALGTDFEAFRDRLDLTNDLWRDDRRRSRFEAELAGVYERIAPFSVRETKSSSGIELPEKIVENVPVRLTGRQRELYDEVRSQLGAQVVMGGDLVDDDAEAVLKRLLRLVQVASNPRLVDEAYDGEPAKLAALRALMGRVQDEGAKAIVWTNFVGNVEWLADRMREHSPVVVHGSVTPEARGEALSRFKADSTCRLLVATPGAAKEGLTLTVANHAVFYDRSFSLDDYLQAQDRIHRISQVKTCHVWNLIGVDTIDEWVESLLGAKRLAAQLAQADIDAAEYTRLASYDFGRIIGTILAGGDHA